MYYMYICFTDQLLKEAMLGKIKNYFKFLKHFLLCYCFEFYL